MSEDICPPVCVESSVSGGKLETRGGRGRVLSEPGILLTSVAANAEQNANFNVRLRS